MQQLPELPSSASVFEPAETNHVRRHGPRGYVDDTHFKPWLRDEFDYCCLYCQCREVWFPDGDHSFSVEHLRPNSVAPPALTNYDTLVYACCQCNAARRATPLPLDPTGPMREHLELHIDGTVLGKSSAGEDFIRICRLNRPNLVAFRRLMLDVLTLLKQKQNRDAVELCRRFFGYPANLPNLAALRPPRGNSLPQGIEQSAYIRRGRGELPDTY